MFANPLQFHHRQLQRLEHSTGHVRPRYGGSISDGLKRGSLVKHSNYELAYVGGYMKKPTQKNPDRKLISLYCTLTGKRLARNAVSEDLKFLSFNSWRTALKIASSVSSAN